MKWPWCDAVVESMSINRGYQVPQRRFEEQISMDAIDTEIRTKCVYNGMYTIMLVTAAMKLKDAYSLEKSYDQPR